MKLMFESKDGIISPIADLSDGIDAEIENVQKCTVTSSVESGTIMTITVKVEPWAEREVSKFKK